MAYKDVDAQMSTEDKNLVIQKFREAESLIAPIAINLTLNERKELPVMGKKLFGFAETAIEYQRNHPHLVPAFSSLEDQEKDMALTVQLRELLEVIEPIYEKIKDTYMAVSAEAYLAARVFYDSVKAAAKAGVPGTNSISRDLGKIYKKSIKKTSDTSESNGE